MRDIKINLRNINNEKEYHVLTVYLLDLLGVHGKVNLSEYEPDIKLYMYVTNNLITTGDILYDYTHSANEEVLFDKSYPKIHYSTSTYISPSTKYNSIMLDIETLGTEPGAVVLSIGAVSFDMATGKTGSEFYEKIRLDQSLGAGFKINADTLKWWASQRVEIFSEAIIGSLKLDNVMNNFHNWVTSNHEVNTVEVWGNSNRFDIGLIAPYFKAVSLELPWKYYCERDVRTLVSLSPNFKTEEVAKVEELGLDLHNPIIDCKIQIAYCYKTFKAITTI